MMNDILWRNGLNEAMKEAEQTGKLLFMFFHRPHCEGCNKTITTTFADENVQKMIEGDFIPLTYLVTENVEIAEKYNVEWTPTFIIADKSGKELERSVGFLPPEDFAAQMELSEGLADFHLAKYPKAEICFVKVIKEHGKTATVPEAYYYLGVSQYKESGDAAFLAKTSETLSNLYPGNEWTKRASVWAA